VSESLGVSPEKVSARIFTDKATGMKDGKRTYGDILALGCCGNEGGLCQPNIEDLIGMQERITKEHPTVTRVLYEITARKHKEPYVIAVRAIETRDFLTAQVSHIPWATLKKTAKTILDECPNVSNVYYDVTPKPPATVEME